MEKNSSNHSYSGVFDNILLEKCLWIIDLKPCSSLYALCVIIKGTLLFIAMLCVTSQWVKKVLRTQRALSRHRMHHLHAASVEGGHPNTTHDQEGHQDRQEQRSSVVSNFTYFIENLKISNPMILGTLVENLVFSMVGMLAYFAIDNEKTDILEMCTFFLTLQAFIRSVIEVALIVKQREVTKYLVAFVFIAFNLYGALVLWSYCRVLNNLEY